MSQQLAIMVMIDVEAALDANTLEGNIYLFDNMRMLGSTGEGTGALNSAINGSYWSTTKTQAEEQVFNWLLLGIDSLPPTLPRDHFKDKAKTRQNELLRHLNSKIKQKKGDSLTSDEEDHAATILKQVKHLLNQENEDELLDLMGNYVYEYAMHAATDHSGMAYPNPIITEITGEAVDENIIFPAQYGSPALATDGWYWSATTDTSRPGVYAYTLHIHLHKPAIVDGKFTYLPVTMRHQAYLKVTSGARVNGFTNAGVGCLPLCG